MEIQIIPEVGDQFEIKDGTLFGFSFTNKHGGTGMSNWEHNEKYEGPPPVVKITKVWHDYETGYRCWAEAVNPELKAYLKKNAKKSDQRVFVGEFDIKVIEA